MICTSLIGRGLAALPAEQCIVLQHVPAPFARLAVRLAFVCLMPALPAELRVVHQYVTALYAAILLHCLLQHINFTPGGLTALTAERCVIHERVATLRALILLPLTCLPPGGGAALPAKHSIGHQKVVAVTAVTIGHVGTTLGAQRSFRVLVERTDQRDTRQYEQRRLRGGGALKPTAARTLR